MSSEPSHVPVINISSLLGDDELAKNETAREIFNACKNVGFFYISHHGVDEQLESELDRVAREFFRQPRELKRRTTMDKGGSAWRGYFEVGEELTSGVPDLKEGLYYGLELPATDARVAAGLPMHGPNLWTATLPEAAVGDAAERGRAEPPSGTADYLAFLSARTRPEDARLRELVTQWIAAMTGLAHTVMSGIARSLGLPPSHFADTIMSDPLVLFRIFNYPNPAPLASYWAEHGALPDKAAAAASEGKGAGESPAAAETGATAAAAAAAGTGAGGALAGRKLFSVGEHTDYGVLTLLRQDFSGGLEVRRAADGEWVAAPPIAGTFVVNIGDMLEKMTGGALISTPHRVINPRAADRVSFPLFFDPSFDAKMDSLVEVSPVLRELVGRGATAEGRERSTYKRWDGKEIGLNDFQGTYGDYILGKVSKVFPQLARAKIAAPAQRAP